MINLSNPQPMEWFTDEFLYDPGPFWEVCLPPDPPMIPDQKIEARFHARLVSLALRYRGTFQRVSDRRMH